MEGRPDSLGRHLNWRIAQALSSFIEVLGERTHDGNIRMGFQVLNKDLEFC